MIDLSPVPSAIVSALPPSPVASGTGNVPGAFGQTLDAFLDANDAASAQIPPLAATGQRHGLAEDGKGLPETASPDDEHDPDIQGNDIGDAPTWFPAFLLPALPPAASKSALADTPVATTTTPAPVTPAPVTPAPVTPANVTPAIPALPGTTAPSTDLADTVRSLAQAAPPPPDAAAPVVVPRPAPRAPAPIIPGIVPPVSGFAAPASPPAIAGAGATTAIAPVIVAPTGDAIAAVVSRTAPVAPKPSDDIPRPVLADTPPLVAVRTDPASQAIAVSATPQPAGQVFAAAIATASSWRARSSHAPERDSVDLAAALPAAASTPGERAIVTATGNTQGSALDLTRDTGLQHMIDRIETLRDDASEGADARDTRVRLTPDALGSVDIAVRQEGDRVHVHFTAEQDATRALIADAQPRLTELAAARGVRIGETSVGADSTASDTRQQPQTQANPRFARAPVPVATETATTDSRIA